MSLRRVGLFVNLGLAAVLMLAVWALIVFVASRPALRKLIDLTPQQVNSVDQATKDLIAELREKKVEVQIHMFFPATAGKGRDAAEEQMLVIRDRLQSLTRLLARQYVIHGGELMTVVNHDLYTGLKETREAAQKFNYKGPDDAVVVAVTQPGREMRFRTLSLLGDLAEIDIPGLRQQQVPGPQTVPTLKRYLGEEQISSAIKSLLVQGSPVAYFLTSYSSLLDLSNASIGIAYGNLIKMLGDLGFDVRRLDLNTQHVVPKDAALVVVLEPTIEFTDQDAQALFAYVQQGGRLFLNYIYKPGGDRNPAGGKLGELLGFEVGQQEVLHMIRDPGNRTRNGLDGDPAVERLQLYKNPEHKVTGRLVDVPLEVDSAREVRQRPSLPAGITQTQLLRTGELGWLGQLAPDGTMDLRAPRGGRLREFLIGLAIEVAADPAADPTAPAGRPGQVIVVSGAFCNNDGLPRFGDLAINICNWMAERTILMNIQNRKYQPKQIDVQPPQLERVGTLLIWFVPGGILAIGLVVLFVRRL